MGNKQSCCIYPGGRSSGRSGNTHKGSCGEPSLAPGPLCLPPTTNWNARSSLPPRPPNYLQPFNTLPHHSDLCSPSRGACAPPPPSVTHATIDGHCFEAPSEPISLTYPRARPSSGAAYYRTVSGPAGSTMLVQGGRARPCIPLSDFVPPYKNSRFSVPLPSHCSDSESCQLTSDNNTGAVAATSAVDFETLQCQKLLQEAEEYQKRHGRRASASVDEYRCYSSKRLSMNVSEAQQQRPGYVEPCSGCNAEAGLQPYESGALRSGHRRASGSDARKRHTTNLNSFYYVPDTSYSFDREDFSWGDPNLHPGSSRYRHSIHVDSCRPREGQLPRLYNHYGQTTPLNHANSFSHHPHTPSNSATCRDGGSRLKFSEDCLPSGCPGARQRCSSGEDGANYSCVPRVEVPYNRSASQPASSNNLPEYLLTKVSNLIPGPLRSSNNLKQSSNKTRNSYYLSTDSDISNLSSSVHSTLSRKTHKYSGRQYTNDENAASLNDHFSRAPSNCSFVTSSKSDVSTNYQSAYNYPPSQTSSQVPVPSIRRLSFLPPIPILPDSLDGPQPESGPHMPLRDSSNGVVVTKGPKAPARSHASKSKQHKTVTKPPSSSSFSYFSSSYVCPDPPSLAPAVVVASSSVSQASLTSSFRYPPHSSSSLCYPTFPPPPPSHSHPTHVAAAASTSVAPPHARNNRPWAVQTSGGGNVVDGRNGNSGGGAHDQRGGSAAGACGNSVADTASSGGEDGTTNNIQHISEREHDDLDQDPSLHPTAGPMFLSKARHAQQNGIVRRRSRNELDNGRNLKKSSSCSTIYLDDSTVSQPNLKNTIKCVALAVYYHIRNTSSKRTLDIFDEKLHPLSKDGVHPDYDKNLPEHRHIYKFVRTLFNAAQLTAECAIITLVYLERLLTYAELDMTAGGWKRIVLGAIILASKVWDDQAVWNVDYCQILRDMSVDDMNELERQYLVMIQFNINVPASVYAKYYFSLRTLAEENDLSFPAEPLSKERAHKLEAMSRDCEDRYAAMLQDSASLGKKWSSLDNVNANHRRSVAILS